MSSSTVAYTQRRIIRFYDPAIRAADLQGRSLSSILAWSDAELEDCHDYIQNLFPLPEPSPFNPAAPLVSSGVFTAFRTRPELRNRLKEAFCRMLKFYGFKLHLDGANEIVVKGDNFGRASRNWVTRFNHNHLRITRIIRSLRVLGLEQQAAAFFVALEKVCEGNGRTIGSIGERSLEFWTRAATWPLYIAPDNDNEDKRSSCEGFLWDFEEYRQRGGEQRDGYESGVIDHDAAVRPEIEDNPPALATDHEDSGEGSDETDGAVGKVNEAKSSSENDSDAPTFLTHSKKRRHTASDSPPRTRARPELPNTSLPRR